MELSAIVLARVIFFVESFDLNPRGGAFYPDVVSGLVQECGFMKYPTKLEEFDEDKGVEFVAGRWRGVTIEGLKIFRNGLMLDTRVSTAESERILSEALGWAVERFGIVFAPRMIKRKAFVSNLTFECDQPILVPSTPVARLASRVQETIRQISSDNGEWQPTILTFHSDPVPRKPLHAAFSIQRRVDTAFADNKYYSEAPLPTDVHWTILQSYAKELSLGTS